MREEYQSEGKDKLAYSCHFGVGYKAMYVLHGQMFLDLLIHPFATCIASNI